MRMQMKNNITSSKRTIILAVLLILVFTVFSIKLAQMQLIDVNEYKKEADILSVQTAVIKAARGEILDRYGRPLAVNREGYNIVFDASYLSVSNRNETIVTIINLLTSQNEKWRDNLPM